MLMRLSLTVEVFLFGLSGDLCVTLLLLRFAALFNCEDDLWKGKEGKCCERSYFMLCR